MKHLYVRVLIAIALGVAVGMIVPDFAASLDILGTGFVRLVKMTIAPLIFCTIVVGIAGMKSMKSVGKAGGLALLYFEVASTVALGIGLLIINVVKPGEGMHARLTSGDASKVADITKKKLDAVQMILDDIPDGFFGALAKGDLLPVLVLAILFGFALHRTGERGKPIFDFIERGSHVIFEMIGLVMLLAPVGAFGAMASTVAKFGVDSLEPLVILMLCFYATCITFVVVVLGAIASWHGFSIFRYLAYIWEELLIVLGTSSSESVLPRMMKKLEAAGASKSVVGLVIPAGYSFNLDGTAIYLTMAAVFLAQATDTPMPLESQLALLAVLLLTSKGAAGVTGSGFVVLSATLGAIGDVPPEAIVLILGIDRFMSEARALTNVCGNGVATLVVAKWCRELDDKQLKQVLG